MEAIETIINDYYYYILGAVIFLIVLLIGYLGEKSYNKKGIKLFSSKKKNNVEPQINNEEQQNVEQNTIETNVEAISSNENDISNQTISSESIDNNNSEIQISTNMVSDQTVNNMVFQPAYGPEIPVIDNNVIFPNENVEPQIDQTTPIDNAINSESILSNDSNPIISDPVIPTDNNPVISPVNNVVNNPIITEPIIQNNINNENVDSNISNI